jgi:hypothetical protein
VALLGAAPAARAQAAPDAAQAAPAYSVVPRIAVTQTFTDNVNLTPKGQSDQITELSPGIRLSRDVGRVRGYFDYALRAIRYAQTQSAHPDNLQQALSTAALAEVVDQKLFVDVSGSISQQGLTALGPLAGSDPYGNANTAEVSSFRLSPFARGSLGGLADYTARVSRTVTQGNTGNAPGVGETVGSLDLSKASAFGPLGWSLGASRDSVDYSAGRATESDQLTGGLTLAFSTQLSAFVRGGRESNNYSSEDKQDYATSDAGFTWNPSPQTQAAASWGQRAYGQVHDISLVHQTPLWALRYADHRGVSTVPGQLLPLLLVPVQGRPVIGLFTTTALALQSRQDLSLSLLGVRDTLTLALSQSEDTRIDTLSISNDELLHSTVHQSGAILALNHRLTPRYTVALQTAQQDSSAGQGQPDSRLRELTLSLQGQLTRKGQVAVNLRRANYSGATSYDQTALSVSLTFGF